MMEDIILMNAGKPQIYGTQVSSISGSPWVLYELAKPEFVNKRREKVGLGPIEDYLKKFGIDFNEPQIE